MPGLDESLAMHKLSVYKDAKPKMQRRRNFAPDRQKAIDDEIDKMLDADLICEVTYPQWVANVGPRQETQWQVEGMRGLHRPQCSVSQRPLSSTKH